MSLRKSRVFTRHDPIQPSGLFYQRILAKTNPKLRFERWDLEPLRRIEGGEGGSMMGYISTRQSVSRQPRRATLDVIRRPPASGLYPR